MKTKLSQLKDEFAKGNFSQAIRIASKFHDLGNERNKILDANLAITNPRWMLGLGKNIDQTIKDGIDALRIRYTL